MDEAEVVTLLYQPEASKEDLIAVICDSGLAIELREGALNHPGLTDEVIDALLDGTIAGPSRVWILAFTDRAEILAKWARSEDPSERATVAFNPATSEDAAMALLSDPEPLVRSAVVFHPAVPLDVVQGLAASDPSDGVRENAHDALTTSAGWALRQGRRWALVSGDE